jgi:enoyl-CoA hydratase/carnithine racemase
LISTTMSTPPSILIEERGHAGLITLNRPQALNALNLGMVREITAALLNWKEKAHVKCVAIRAMGKQPRASAQGQAAPFGLFCAGGDIRFFHQAACSGDPALEDFFTEEYTLNHLIHTYPKPYVVFMDGINMGGGMGISGHGGSNSIRLATERLNMAMPETHIGLFPDVGGGWFLSRCPGSVGEYLALTGAVLGDVQAITYGLADHAVHSSRLTDLWDQLPLMGFDHKQQWHRYIGDDFLPQTRLSDQCDEPSFAQRLQDFQPADALVQKQMHLHFSQDSIAAIVQSLHSDPSAWAQQTLAVLRKRSPLMLAVTLELIRRARTMNLADELRLERDLVRHCFHTRHLQRSGTTTETVEGIRALVIDKDHTPKWNPARIEEVMPEMVRPFFDSPWPMHAHPLRHL